MSKIQTIFSHLTVILSFMFGVFLILDQFNPMMNFIDNHISRWLLAALCMGFERLVMYLTDIENIRDVIPYHRTPGNCDF